MKIVPEMHFLIFSDTDVKFGEKVLEWSSYITVVALLNTKRVEFIDKREFINITLDENVETLVVHIATLSMAPIMLVYPLR